VPAGVTVCQLSLVSATPGALGDTLLLTRLERGQEPVSVRIATQRCQGFLWDFLWDFCWDSFWDSPCDSFRDSRRVSRGVPGVFGVRIPFPFRVFPQSLIQSLDSEVLGCWRGLLLPRDPEDSPLDEQELSQLLQELRECGWERP
ncbi:ESPL1 protein, partial [Rhodinocichla rosea]|nr:ESPL1 protein [Rhodinocichla rosea]